MNDASYAHWRTTIPWSNEEIVAQLRRDAADRPATDGGSVYMRQKYTSWADWVERTGRLSGAIVRHCLPALITTCAICKKTALYRQGVEGRCSAHRMILSAPVAARKLRAEEASVQYASAWADTDRRDKSAARRAGGGNSVKVMRRTKGAW